MNFHKIKESRHKIKTKKREPDYDDGAIYFKFNSPLGRVALSDFLVVTCPFNILRTSKDASNAPLMRILVGNCNNFEFFLLWCVRYECERG